MAIIEAESQNVKDLIGVHVFHSPFSNCSQRVRLVLEEKAIRWESHIIELMEFEHLTDEYQAIHPKGMVPALVHNGIVVVESNEIIQYLDDHFPGSPLMPQTKKEKARVEPWMKIGADLQDAIKTLTYDRVLGKNFPPTPEKLLYYEQHQRNPDLVEFWRRFLKGFDPILLAAYEQQVIAFLEKLNGGLRDKTYLTGENVTLADFSAVVNVHRAKIIGLSLDGYPNTARWYDIMRRRPSFENAILAYVPD